MLRVCRFTDSTSLLLRGRFSRLALLGQQSKLAHTSRANAVDCVHHLAVVRSDVRAHINLLAGLVLQLRRDLAAKVVDRHLVAAEEGSAISGYGNNNCI